MTHNLTFSVVIASVNGLPIISECLENLQQQVGIKELEVVVADRCNDDVRNFIRNKYGWVKLIEAQPKTTIPQLRAMAFRETSGDIIAVLEDHCLVEPDWALRMINAHNREYSVIGGSVENAACDSYVDWAAFFCEYSQAMKPIPEGEVETIPGNNVSYKRWVYERFQHLTESGFWDTILHEHIRNENISLYSMPSITVYHKLSASFYWFLTQKYHFARSFAGMRFPEKTIFRRAIYAVGSVLLPVILFRRIVSRVWQKNNYRQELLRSLPFLALLLLGWGIGEMLGYILGPGSSSAKVA